MGAISTGIFAQLGGTTWTNLAADATSVQSLFIRYGIPGSGPRDALASPGECRFTLRNDARNSGSTQGWYSPLHASVRSGWTHNIRLQVVFSYETALAVSSMTRSGSTVTVTTSSAHGWTTGDRIFVSGAVETDYNNPSASSVVKVITVTGGSTFTFSISTTPTSPATGTITVQRVYTKFNGKIDRIDPEPGRYLTQRVHVTAYDWMRDLHETRVRDVDLQVNETEDAVIGAVLDALPSAHQPLDRSIGTGLDLIPYALDDIGTGVPAASVLHDLLQSSYGLGYIEGTGRFVYLSRNDRANAVSAFTFSDDLHALVVPSSRSAVFDLIRTTTHHKDVDAANVVIAAVTGSPPYIPPGETVTFDLPFRSPDDATRLIGAASIVTPLVSGTDYAGNSAPDGSLTDLAADLDITVTDHASRVVIEVENTGSTGIYLVTAGGATLLQVRGTGLYDDGPRTQETGTGTRELDYDMPYGSDEGVAEQIAGLILEQYGDLPGQALGLTRKATTDTYRRQALAREPGHVMTASETLTGLSSAQVEIRSVQLDLDASNLLTVTWGVGPRITAVVPNAPTSLTATIISDTQVDLDWSTGSGAGGAVTHIYQGGLHVGTAPVGAVTYLVTGLTRATNYTFTVRHVQLGLVSAASNSVVARPVFYATGGTVSSSGGYRRHVFTSSGTFTVSQYGTVDSIIIVGGGGGGGGGSDPGGDDRGGGGGGGGGTREITMNVEPNGAWTITIGGGGSGGAVDNQGGTGTGSAYRDGDAGEINTVGGGGGGNGEEGAGAAGLPGGSGGGGGGGDTGGAAGTAASGEGSAGGTGGGPGNGNPAGGGGGGGKGSAGTNGGASGGAGGSGGVLWHGTYGAGGQGGRGGSPAAGAANTGNGGGGGPEDTIGYNGGSGVIAIRYLE